jgi:hypothetical protein
MPGQRGRGRCPIFCMSCWACSLSRGRCRYDHIQVNREPGRSSHANGLHTITCDVQQSTILSVSGRLQTLMGIKHTIRLFVQFMEVQNKATYDTYIPNTARFIESRDGYRLLLSYSHYFLTSEAQMQNLIKSLISGLLPSPRIYLFALCSSPRQ